MGSFLSRATSRLQRKGTVTSSVQKPVHSDGTSKKASRHGTMAIPTNVSNVNVYQRETSAEWGEKLKQMSGVISTSAWQDDEDMTQGHAARRSSKLKDKLPSRLSREATIQIAGSVDNDGIQKKPFGRLLQHDVLQLFELRRGNCREGQVGELSKHYSISEQDMRNLLLFTRTYMGRLDADDMMHGFYNPDPLNTISRFERD